MTKTLVACINFNSYKELDAYLQSIDIAVLQTLGSLEVDVVVADNTVENYQTINTNYKNINVQAFPFHENLGYIGGATKMFELIGEEKVKSYDYVIISNVDLELDNTFFIQLSNVDSDGVGFIAPRITTIKNNNQENPFITHRPSSLKMKLFIAMYKYPTIYAINKLKFSIKAKQRNSSCSQIINKEIYAGHGSIMIFTKGLVEKHFPFKYKSFMYGEEIFFAELTYRSNLKCLFTPLIQVYNIGNVSTKFLGNKRRCLMSAKSFQYLYKTFWQ